ncbi:MAG: hypothetical protein CSA33_04430 [Desulfobulbus propionicus]|nr:MAG: hypothetical protein CSA33_04430 [Desulfobulbus propionicus]
MRTLVTCQDKSAGSGYTLLEVLLILMMMALLSGIALQTEQPIHYNAKGVCSGGRITITSQAYAVEYQIHAPDGRLQKNGMAAR